MTLICLFAYFQGLQSQEEELPPQEENGTGNCSKGADEMRKAAGNSAGIRRGLQPQEVRLDDRQARRTKSSPNPWNSFLSPDVQGLQGGSDLSSYGGTVCATLPVASVQIQRFEVNLCRSGVLCGHLSPRLSFSLQRGQECSLWDPWSPRPVLGAAQRSLSLTSSSVTPLHPSRALSACVSGYRVGGRGAMGCSMGSPKGSFSEACAQVTQHRG